MSVTQIQDAPAGESLIAIEPELLQQVDAGWLHRLSLFNGRTLTATALSNEQAYRAGRLAILGQCVTHGVVKGLELSANLTLSDPALQVTSGYGISASGEDITLLRTLSTTLGALLVIDPQTGSSQGKFPDFIANPANISEAGVLLLQPISATVPGASVDTGTAPLIVSGNLGASCDQDPLEYAFEDWQIVDGARLVMVAWPAIPTTLSLPPASPAVNFRNRLAYTVFNAEMALAPDDRLPWDLLGLPVGLIGFDSAWKAQFVDRWSVTRNGGLSRTRYVLPAQPSGPGTPLLVQPALAQARVAQLAEQVSESPGLATLAPSFALLPPCGMLPAAAMDFVHKVALWFPANWNITAGPVHQEEIETALLSSMTAQPLDVAQNETVEVLVPLPDALYDPDILVTETVSPEFQQAVDSATAELAGALQHRKTVQQEANALSLVITGSVQSPLYDLDAGLNANELALRDNQVYVPATDETFATEAKAGSSPPQYSSIDYDQLIATAGAAPYTIFNDGNGNPLATPLPLFSAADLNDISINGLQHFIDRIHAKVARANDLLDLAFLTTQSDIYRFRQYVLGAAGATALAVSPIAAEIATGESAASTADNLRNYLTSVLPSATTTPGPTTTPSPNINASRTFLLEKFSANLQLKSPTTLRQSSTLVQNLASLKTSSSAFQLTAAAAAFVPTSPGTVAQPASTSDVTSQSPLVGAQLNLRTLSIASRLANPPSQEGLFYGIGNRTAFLELIADLDLTIDDIPILVDTPPPPVTTGTTTTAPPNFVYAMPILAEIRATANATRRGLIFQAIQTPVISTAPKADPDEASLFSTGIHVLEQHTTLLRAIEGRVQLYNDFLGLCGSGLGNVQFNLPLAQALLSQLENAMAQARQDLAFTTTLLNDEIQRVDDVNTQRQSTLRDYVSVIAFLRPRTVVSTADVPSRQLVPGNVLSPVPACTSPSTAVPPELREIVALLREAPVSWLPAVQALLNRLERPSLLQNLAVDAQARASMQLQLPLRQSSAAPRAGVYAPVITGIYGANQQAFRSLQVQRAAIQPVQLALQSWSASVQSLQIFAAVGDLIASSFVHAEIVNKTSSILQQISSVGTCLYVRAGQMLPINRLEWAEFLRGLGMSIQLQSLAVLPGWNSIDYIPRQQMQMLVDWLFQQIDTTNAKAVAFMSDVVRVSILLASDAPVATVIGGAIALATTPTVGGIISLTLPSERVVHGMYVQLYSAGELAAHAVVTDLDSSTVRATITTVVKPGVTLQANDVAHFTAQAPETLAIRAFDK